MKKTVIPFIIGILILATGCYRAENPAAEPTPNFIIPDSLLAPTGDPELDSLLQVVATAPVDTNLIPQYLEICEYYENVDFEKAKEHYALLKDLSEQLHWDRGYYWYVDGSANVLTREGLSDSALVILNTGIEWAEQKNYESWAANLKIAVGNVYFSNGWYESALSCYMEALHFLEKGSRHDILSNLYQMMSQTYRQINMAKSSIEYGEKAVALNPEFSYALNALARAYSSDNQNEKAKEYFEKALAAATLQNNLYLMGVIYFHFADLYYALSEFDQAEKYAFKSIEINEQIGFSNNLGELVLLGHIEFKKGNFGKAEKYAREALQFLEEIEEFEHLEETKICYILLSELALAQHRYPEFFQYKERWETAEKELAREAAIRSSEEMAAKYETAKKDLEIERQHSIIGKQNLQRWLLVGGIATCVLVLALLWYMLRLRSRRNRALQEKTEILTEMNATKNKFFSVISHDLKNPAISLRDALQILLNNAQSWDVDTLNKYYNELLKSSENHVELIYSLLSWAQIQTGRISFTPAQFFLPKLLPELTMIRKMAENKEITLNIAIPEEAVVSCDINMLLTVVRNLLTNAVKFTPTGGTVQLDVSPCRDAINRVSPKYTISITDTGIGMSQQQITELFSLDTLHSHKGTGGEEGSGLGLIICKEFLEKHNSTLHIESEVGKGSRVWFEI